MKLYLLYQDDNNGYDTFDSCVVCANDENDAKNIMPDWSTGKPFEPSTTYGYWASSIEGVNCKYIGEATEDLPRGIVVASFNAG